MIPKLSIHRVVTCFILSSQNPDPKVAIFRRASTMPSYADCWAGISGTIEENETPFQAMKRELDEETNLVETASVEICNEQGGLYVDVNVASSANDDTNRPSKILRVYPFVVYLKDDSSMNALQLKGTEHDCFDFVSVQELYNLKDQSVPALHQAFVHATFGRYPVENINDEGSSPIPKAVYDWAKDKENGASVMIHNALDLLKRESSSPRRRSIAYFMRCARPSMVPIVNVMQLILNHDAELSYIDQLENSLQSAMDDTVALARAELKSMMLAAENGLTIATISRSGTLRKVLEPFTTEGSCRIICSQSTPGDEGKLMANDLGSSAICIKDDQLLEEVSKSQINVILIGADCILSSSGKTKEKIIINKVGTKKLCQVAQVSNTPVLCCSDRFKIWDDVFAPPLELDLFEEVPESLVTKLLLGN
jgi:translation initiation factor 2B subunit (eIF-2B alpha/beta/delta family)/8-oxo-dGTP pyrophosphatase MutT (NUDIX family)